MTKKLPSVPQMMRLALDEGWGVMVRPAGHRFCVRVWDRDRAHSVDGTHGTFGPALREALELAYRARGRGAFDRGPSPGREPAHPSGPGGAIPSPHELRELLESDRGELVA